MMIVFILIFAYMLIAVYNAKPTRRKPAAVNKKPPRHRAPGKKASTIEPPRARAKPTPTAWCVTAETACGQNINIEVETRKRAEEYAREIGTFAKNINIEEIVK